MGSAAKIILIGAASLVVGIYSLSLKRVQAVDLTTSISQASRVQTESFEDYALRFTLYRVQHNRDNGLNPIGFQGDRSSLGGGTFHYDVWYTSTPTFQVKDIYSTITLHKGTPDQKIMDVYISKVGVGGDPAFPYTRPGHRHFVRGRWQITKVFVRPLNG